ncbi:MAG: pyridoxal 5'-phosphate synthase glutaminase subunit PdxT [Bacteroidetes bacterium]|nr:pyridoxal 5'-phosphate synthase glutaminase subunit PdxT [Bacteroidota bacterium]
MARVGVLALQGAFREHKTSLLDLGVEAPEVRLPRQLAGLDGLIIPGGESTTIGKLMVAYGLLEPLRRLAAEGFPMFGTCAGMIVLARDIGRLDQPLIGVMDIKVCRNAFGRQVDSFEADIPIPALGPEPFRAVFIRAPLIDRVGDGVEVLARLDDGRIVAARQENLLASAFHPELTGDRRLHQYFLAMLNGR